MDKEFEVVLEEVKDKRVGFICVYESAIRVIRTRGRGARGGNGAGSGSGHDAADDIGLGIAQPILVKICSDKNRLEESLAVYFIQITQSTPLRRCKPMKLEFCICVSIYWSASFSMRSLFQ